MPAVPLFDQSRPYQQLVFQYDLRKPTQCRWAHHTYTERLAESNGDPRPR
ncbi:MAG: DUF2779 domain-containing protein [Bacteroidetes bacterium]|nr:DUF2779 domain-containing protein [Bacteroidota bacterium]